MEVLKPKHDVMQDFWKLALVLLHCLDDLREMGKIQLCLCVFLFGFLESVFGAWLFVFSCNASVSHF